MTVTGLSPRATMSHKLLIDCRDLAADMTAESVVTWVMSFPVPSAMHVVLPSSAPEIRRLQCTLQGLGCAVSRVTRSTKLRVSCPVHDTKCLPSRHS